MKIEYFERGNFGYGVIFRHSIDTEDENYISHTEDSVTFKDSYNDDYWNTKYHNVTMSRNFIDIRNELIAYHKEEIANRQKEIDILEASDSIEQYNSIIYKNK